MTELTDDVDRLVTALCIEAGSSVCTQGKQTVDNDME